MDKVVVYAGTQNVYPQMYTALKSLLKNNQVDRVYLLIETDEFPYQVPENVIVCNVSKQEFYPKDSPNVNTPWSYMDLLKCSLSAMLPEEEEYALWLDIDTIVDADISELFDVDMTGYFYAGAMELSKSNGIFCYINAGVLLCNLKLLRLFQRDREIMLFLNTYKFAFPSQDVLNLLCQGRIKLIGSEFNSNDFTLPCTRPKIIHFAAVKDYKEEWAYKKYENTNLL